MSASIRVLIVEDSPSDAALVVRQLEKADYEVQWERVELAHDMRAALEEAPWDVVIADYNLPRFNATDALSLLKRTGLDIPFIVVSGTIGEDVAVGLMRAGAKDYLMKGKLTRLSDAVKRELQDAQDRRERRRAEKALRENEERIRSVASNTPGLVFQLRAKSIVDYRISMAMGRSQAIFGIPFDEQTDFEKFVARLDARDREPFMASIEQAVTEAKPWTFEGRLQKTPGETIWFKALSSPAIAQHEIVFNGLLLDITEQKRTEEALRAERDTLKGLSGGLAATGTGVDIVDLDYRIVSQNLLLEDRFGESVGKLCYETYMGQTEPCDPCPMRQALENNRIERKQLRAGDGRYYEIVSAPLPNPDGTADKAIEVVLDMTERKQAEEALLEERNLLRTTIDAIPDGIFVKDRESRLLLCNRHFREHWGLEDPIGKTDFDVYPEAEAKVYRDEEEDIIETGNAALSVEHSAASPSTGKAFHFLSTKIPVRNQAGEIVGLVGCNRDITAHKRAEQRAARFSRMLEGSLNEIYVFDAETLHFVEVNRGARENMGYSMGELRELTPLDIKPEVTAESFAELVEPLRAGTQEVVQFTTVHQRKNGTRYPVEVYLQLMADGSPVFVAVIFDITERRRGEERRELRNEVLAALNQSDGMLETIRNVLAVIKERTGIEAVGIRLREGEDFPYYVTRGFSDEFVEAENYLCARDHNGKTIYDPDGSPCLECMCGNVLRGRFDPLLPFFTEGGSFWSNCTSDMLASATEEDLQSRTRNRCNGEGYESVALIPVRVGDETIGLLQLNDRRKGMHSPEDIHFFENLCQSVAISLARKQAVDALREERNFSKSLLDTVQAIVLMLDTEGRVVSFGPYFEELSGYRLEEVKGQDWFATFLPPENRQSIHELFSKAIAGMQTRGFVNSILTKDGRLRQIEWYDKVMEDSEGAIIGLLCTGQDVTKRLLAEQAVRSSEALLRTVMDNLPDCVYVKDMAARKVLVNRADLESIGRPEAEVLGRTDMEFFPEEVAARCYADDQSVLQTGQPLIDREELVVNNAGREHWLLTTKIPLRDENGQVTGLVGIGHDITERRQTEEVFKSLVESVVGVTGQECFDAITGGLSHWPGMDNVILGKIEPEGKVRTLSAMADGKRISDFDYNLSGTPSERIVEKGYCACVRGVATLFPEDTLLVDMGAEGYVGTPIRDRNGKAIGILCAISRQEISDSWQRQNIFDILATKVAAEIEREQIQEDLELSEAQLRQAQKMEAVGQLAGGVAHDFNNILQAFQGYGELAMGDIAADGPARECLDEMMKASNRAAVLVSQLLAFSRRQVLEMATVDLNDVIADLMKMIRRVIGEHVTLSFVPGHDLGAVRADRGQIEQILMNLSVNARDAMPEGGRITIETENVTIDEAFCETHPWADPGRYALLSVTDTGCGMDDEMLDKVFEPFFTTKGVGEGTGLGLSTVYGLVKQHQGMVHAYSEVGEGTTFKIYLPLTERSAAAVDDKVEAPVRGGTETILLAEDDEMVRKLSAIILTKAGYTVWTAADGEEALRVFEEHADEIDLALLDVMMPKMGGKEAFDRIRQKRPQVSVLFASGYSMNAIHTSFVLDDSLDLIQKPYGGDALLRGVREVLDAKREGG